MQFVHSGSHNNHRGKWQNASHEGNVIMKLNTGGKPKLQQTSPCFKLINEETI